MAKTTHGMSRTRLYRIFHDMKRRCYKPKDTSYSNYGGKGIKICKEWLDNQEVFFEWALNNGYDDNLTIDRIDSKGNYEPSNCRWITQKEQNYNLSMPKTNTSGYIGISKATQWKYPRWRAVISIDNKTKTIGYAKTKKDALKLRNDFIIENNLPHNLQEYKDAQEM